MKLPICARCKKRPAAVFITKNENGKLYIHSPKNLGLFFSISHTNDLLFVAFSEENIGIDTENINRNVHYSPIIKKFSASEQSEICSKNDFFTHWTAKEAAIKWLGSSISKDLNALSFIEGKMQYNETTLPLYFSFYIFNEHLVAVCGETDTDNIQFTPFP